jgi:hypothetical protein
LKAIALSEGGVYGVIDAKTIAKKLENFAASVLSCSYTY